MKYQTKLALRRWIIRKLRLAFDALEERLHEAEVTLREELLTARSCRELVNAARRPAPALEGTAAGPDRRTVAKAESPDPPRSRLGKPARAVETFSAWEARRAGVARVARTPRRRRGVSSLEFDGRFA